MSTFSDEMAAIALDLLTEFGEAITLTRTTQGAYVPSTGLTGAPTTSATTGYGVPTDYTNAEIDGELVKYSDTRLYINAVTFAPLAGDEITLDSQDYRIMNVIKYAISSENVLYELQLRV